jgi:ribosomal 50S subunit-associated protein YjgA (DUF615 family)
MIYYAAFPHNLLLLFSFYKGAKKERLIDTNKPPKAARNLRKSVREKR